MLLSIWNQHGLFTLIPDKGLLLAPSPELIQSLIEERERMRSELKALCADEERLEDHAADLARSSADSFITTNQYINFRQRDIRQLERLMRSLLTQLAQLYEQGEITPHDLEQLFNQHALRVSRLLLETNGVQVFQLVDHQLMLRRVPCAEYEASFQLDLLRIKVDDLREPVLDLGCGAQAMLVRALREQGIEAYGLERLEQIDRPFIYAANWLDFHFVPDKWGTIISNMAFSNHFWHHHIRKDGDYAAYAQKYMEILRSLQVGGCFIYAPGLPFIEGILEESGDSYTVIRRELDPPLFEPEEGEGLHGSRWYVARVRRNR
ncbi:hypothetical protein [Laceyella putida]|uniref:Class I SAM-dependent methyltransferase n=1 Tax=Laceyella putida TaxID=110101 RepID=A0ABW2RG47_9BACL